MSENQPLTELDGIDLYERARLAAEGVANVEALAHGNLVDLLLQTRIPAGRLVDWADQAVLYLHTALGPQRRDLFDRLRTLGVRTATDLLVATDDSQGRKSLLRAIGARHLSAERLDLLRRAMGDAEWMANLLAWRRNEQRQPITISADRRTLSMSTPTGNGRHASRPGGAAMAPQAPVPSERPGLQESVGWARMNGCPTLRPRRSPLPALPRPGSCGSLPSSPMPDRSSIWPAAGAGTPASCSTAVMTWSPSTATSPASPTSGTHPRLEAVEVDLEDGRPFPLAGRLFAAVVVTNYLYRPILDDLVAAVGPGGLLLYETFACGNEAMGRPSNPAYLLQPGELLRVVGDRLRVVAFEDVVVEQPRPAVVQRIAAARSTS